jgi:hypothetical protein
MKKINVSQEIDNFAEKMLKNFNTTLSDCNMNNIKFWRVYCWEKEELKVSFEKEMFQYIKTKYNTTNKFAKSFIDEFNDTYGLNFLK